MKFGPFLIFLSTVTHVFADEFATSHLLFTSSIYKESIKSTNGNILVSPFSAEIALALAQSGAKNGTAEEIRTSLYLPESDEEIKSSFKSLLRNLTSKDYLLHTATKLYVTKDFAVREEFKSTAADVYQSEIENVDFSDGGRVAAEINKWVQNRTDNKIKNFVDSNVANTDTAAVIVNTLLFKAEWIEPSFHERQVFVKDFYKTKSEVVEVEMTRHEVARFSYYEDPGLGATFLEVPFKGREAYMVFVLPNEKEGLADLEKEPDKIFKVHSFKKELVEVTTPLFKIESTVNFKDILQQLGVRKAFDRKEADFSGLAGKKGDLVFENILQKTFIDVNKDGVEAAAVTDISMVLCGPPSPNKFFVVDYPFIFYIRAGDVILFAGRVILPST